MERFVFWRPDSDRFIEVGPERRRIPLPLVPLPLLSADGQLLPPTDDAIGRGVYDYLRQHPDCEHGPLYAGLLRDAYPHYLADLAAQIIMLDEKSVDAAYIQRKICGLKILALLEPENSALLLQLAKTSHDLALQFSELTAARTHLLAAMGYLQKITGGQPHFGEALDLLAQIDLWFGDFPAAQRRLRELLELELSAETRAGIEGTIRELESRDIPQLPPIDELEALGQALVLLGSGRHQLAEAVLEGIEHRKGLPQEMLGAEFYYLLGHCREGQGDNDGALHAYAESLRHDAGYLPAHDGMERIAAQGGTGDR